MLSKQLYSWIFSLHTVWVTRCDRCIILPEPSLPTSHFYPNLPTVLETQFKNISSSIKKILNQNNISDIGIYFNYVYKDKIIYDSGYGKIDHDFPNSPPPNKYNTFRIASITKVFTDLMLFQFVENGLLNSMDEQLNEYLLKLHNITLNIRYPPNTYEYNITFHDLGCHMAGLQHHEPCNFNENLCDLTTKQIIERMNKWYGYIIQPGLQPMYSDLGFDLLGNILAESINMTWNDYVIKYILTPLNMTQTSNFYKDIENDICYGYINGVKAPFINLQWASPSGQLYSSPNDLAKLLSFIFRNSGYNFMNTDDVKDIRTNDVLSSRMVHEWMKPVYITHEPPDVTSESAWGLPWEFINRDSLDIKCKSGAIEGYNSMLYFDDWLKFGGIAYYADGGFLSNSIFYDEILGQVYKGFDIIIDYLNTNQPNPIYPTYIDKMIGIYGTEFEEIKLSLDWYQLGTCKFVGIVDNGYYKLMWMNDERNGGNNSDIFYLNSVGNDSCTANGNQQVILNKTVDGNDVIIYGFTAPQRWDLKGPRYWTKID